MVSEAQLLALDAKISAVQLVIANLIARSTTGSSEAALALKQLGDDLDLAIGAASFSHVPDRRRDFYREAMRMSAHAILAAANNASYYPRATEERQ